MAQRNRERDRLRTRLANESGIIQRFVDDYYAVPIRFAPTGKRIQNSVPLDSDTKQRLDDVVLLAKRLTGIKKEFPGGAIIRKLIREPLAELLIHLRELCRLQEELERIPDE